MLDSLPQGPPELRRSWILQALREAIASGELMPGDRLVERDISARTGVSRGPVREAILVLEQEGLVVSHSYRGAQVAEVSADEAEQILLPIRIVLEKFAFRQALGRFTDDDHRALQDLIDEMTRAAKAEDRRALADADIRFHEYVISRSGSPHCERSWHSIMARVRAYFFTDAPRHESMSDVAEQHTALLQALLSGNEDRLMTAVVEHIQTRPGFGGRPAAPAPAAG